VKESKGEDIRKYQRIIFKDNAKNQMRNEYTDSVTRINQSKNTVTVPEYKEKKKVEKKTQRRKNGIFKKKANMKN
jgi:hypothetical protein